MSLEWSDGEEELLIDFFAKHESLHNKHHPDYNFNRKNKLLAELVKELNRMSSGKKFKVDIVSKHWNELRNLYNQHKRKIIKDELTGKKNAQNEPDWIWWKKINNIFTGASVVDKSNESMDFMSDTVHQRPDRFNVSSPAKSSSPRAGTSLTSDILRINLTNSKRRTTMALSPREYDPPIKQYRRRTIHPPSLNNEMKVSPLSSVDDSESELECEVKVIPMAVNRVIAKPFITSTTEERINTTNRGGRHKVNMQSTETSMNIEDTSAPKSANDECSSTAMFVESRLRTYDDFKRQRMIFKIHELFYQEDI